MGRYKSIPEEERLCTLCDMGVVEDEYHFVFYCPLYSDLRTTLFEAAQSKNPDLFWMPESNMLKWLFSEEIFCLARFLEGAWHLRKRYLYPV